MLSTPQPGYTTAEIFCAMTEMNFTDFFVKPAENNADFYNIKELMCTAPGVNGLLDDLRVLTAGNSSYFDNIVSQYVLGFLLELSFPTPWTDNSRVTFTDLAYYIASPKRVSKCER